MPSLKVGDIRISYELRGEGEPLVIVGGLGTDSSATTRSPRASKRFWVLVFDNRGAGRTDKPDSPCAMEITAEDTAGLLEKLGVWPADVLGVSMGGRIALALLHPEKVRSLVLVSATGRPSLKARSSLRFRFSKFVE